MSRDSIQRFLSVRKAMTKADKPASKRSALHGATQLPSFSFDPIVDEAIDAFNKESTKTYFVPGVTWVDIDDDKIPNCSPKWKSYGMKTTPTKDKKKKPVFHLMATIGTGHIIYTAPDKLKLKLGDMLRTAINHVSPSDQEGLRALLAFFIDRGYMELAKQQNVAVTNLIQIMLEMKVKFLGTVKNTWSFPFQFVDINETGKTVQDNRYVVQTYGMRTNFVTHSRPGNHVQASVLRNDWITRLVILKKGVPTIQRRGELNAINTFFAAHFVMAIVRNQKLPNIHG